MLPGQDEVWVPVLIGEVIRPGVGQQVANGHDRYNVPLVEHGDRQQDVTGATAGPIENETAKLRDTMTREAGDPKPPKDVP